MASRLLSRLRHVVGLLVLARWPWPAWRLTGGGALPIGGERFRFRDLAQLQHVWWAHQVRRGRWEPAVIRELSRALRPGDVFFDLGAYVGPFTLLASRLVGPTGQVVAFEPDPRSRALLERNLAANAVDNVIVVPCAVGGYEGAVRFTASGDSVGRVGDTGDIEVPQVTLDGWCAEHGLKPTVMKVDIEGGEAGALDGSAAVRGTRELVVEVHEPPLRAQSVDPRDFLARLGPYTLLEPPDDGNYAVLVRPQFAA
jgi:FkbM family methyltransferase